MNPLIQILVCSSNEFFHIKRVEGAWFETDWHCHKESQIIYFIKGRGKVCTEIDIQNFNAGDICIINSNTSHKYQQIGDQGVHAIVLQLSNDYLGSQFINWLFTARQYQRENTIDQILLYTQNHFQDAITLRQAATFACMSVPSFCLYFKRYTHKTYFDYLNEVRVNNACRQLRETNKSVADIGYESGYNTIAHFHRQFLKLKKTTPLQFRKTQLLLQHIITLKIPAQAI